MISLKSGSNGARIGSENAAAFFFVCAYAVFHKYDLECVITAGIDGKHQPGSLHYKGFAWDIRTFNIPKDKLEEIRLLLKTKLGDDYDVVVEGDHMHCEFDPKSPYTGT